MSDHKYPAPAPNAETEVFWTAAKLGKFLIKRCKECKEPHYFPRALCPFCLGDTDWEESSGEGVIYTYTITRRSPTGPFSLGYVTLKEGPTIYTNFVDCDFDKLKIGARVKVVFKETEGEAPLPLFALADV